MTRQWKDPPRGNSAGLETVLLQGGQPRHNPAQQKQQEPSDRALLTGYFLAMSDVEAHCRYAARELNHCANDLQNLDEDMAITAFYRAVTLIKAAGGLIVELGNGGPS